MSPSSHRHLYIGLAPQEVSLLGFGRGLRPALEIAVQIPVTTVSGQPGWRPALNALSQWLDAHAYRWRAHIVLSNHFVRYAVFPAGSRLRSKEEGLALAAALLDERYGVSVRDWSLRVSPPFGDGGTLVSAMSQALLDGLLGIGTAKVKVAAIRPWLMETANRVGPLVANSPFTLAMVERERITLAHAQRRGTWLNVSSRTVADDDKDALMRILREDAEIAGTSMNECWLDDLFDPVGCRNVDTRYRRIHLRKIAGAPSCLALRVVT